MTRYLLVITILLSVGALPASADTTFGYNGFFDVFLNDDTAAVRVNATGTMIVGSPDELGIVPVLQMSLAGSGPLGGSTPQPVQIRESPSVASTGDVGVKGAVGATVGANGFSVLDIYTEISLDGGQTWLYTLSPLHYDAATDGSQ